METTVNQYKKEQENIAQTGAAAAEVPTINPLFPQEPVQDPAPEPKKVKAKREQQTATKGKETKSEDSKKTEVLNAMAEVHKELESVTIPKNKLVKGMNDNDYSYADLNSIVTATRPLLTKHDLFAEFRQKVSLKKGCVEVTCLLHHKNGYTYAGETIKVPVNIKDIQKITSAITYLKRYQYCAMFNICTDPDDDGLKASERNNRIQNVEKNTSQPTQQETQQPTLTATPPTITSPLQKHVPDQPFSFVKAHKQIHPDLPQKAPSPQSYVCVKCGAPVSQQEAKFCHEVLKLNNPYCKKCQKDINK